MSTLIPGTIDANGCLVITAEEWRKTHRDYKGITNGQRSMLKWIDGKGTCLVPVTVIPEPRKKRS